MGQHDYACGHPAGFHVDARCLGYVNIAAFDRSLLGVRYVGAFQYWPKFDDLVPHSHAMAEHAADAGAEAPAPPDSPERLKPAHPNSKRRYLTCWAS